jgi:hypothetical protein
MNGDTITNFLSLKSVKKKYYNLLLSFLGVWDESCKNIFEDLEKLSPHCVYIRKILNFLYILTILTIVSWSSVYKIIFYFNSNQYKNFLTNSFMVTIPLLYIAELIYFKHSHLQKIFQIPNTPVITSNCVKNSSETSNAIKDEQDIQTERKNSFLSFFNEQNEASSKEDIILNNYALTIFITSFVIATASIIVFYLSNMIEVYDYIKHKSFLFGVLCFFENFYSCLIFLCSVVTFTAIFNIHSESIKEFSVYVNDMQYDINTVNKMFLNYLDLKASYDDSVKKLNSLFSITTFIGFFALYGLVDSMILPTNIFDLFYIIMYLISECVYFYTINKVGKAISLIQYTIFSGSFTQKYLKRQPYQEEVHLIPYETISPTGIMSRVVSANSIQSYDVAFNNEMNIKKIHQIYKIAKDGQTSLDWLILSKLMSVPWKHIELFGFDVDGYNLLKKSIILWIFLLLNKTT